MLSKVNYNQALLYPQRNRTNPDQTAEQR